MYLQIGEKVLLTISKQHRQSDYIIKIINDGIIAIVLATKTKISLFRLFINNRNVLLTVLEAIESKSKATASLFLLKHYFLFSI